MKIAEYEPGVREALEDVFAAGERDGNEHLIVLREGKVIGRADGTPTMVLFDHVDTQPGDITIHNHPASLNALSNGDIAMIFAHGMHAIYSISKDKSVYKAQIGELGRIHPGVWMELSQLAGLVVESEAMQHGELRLNDALSTGGKGAVGIGHWINRMAAYEGAIKYSYDLQPESERLYDELDERIEFPREFRK